MDSPVQMRPAQTSKSRGGGSLLRAGATGETSQRPLAWGTDEAAVDSAAVGGRAAAATDLLETAEELRELKRATWRSDAGSLLQGRRPNEALEPGDVEGRARLAEFLRLHQLYTTQLQLRLKAGQGDGDGEDGKYGRLCFRLPHSGGRGGQGAGVDAERYAIVAVAGVSSAAADVAHHRRRHRHHQTNPPQRGGSGGGSSARREETAEALDLRRELVLIMPEEAEATLRSPQEWLWRLNSEGVIESAVQSEAEGGGGFCLHVPADTDGGGLGRGVAHDVCAQRRPPPTLRAGGGREGEQEPEEQEDDGVRELDDEATQWAIVDRVFLQQRGTGSQGFLVVEERPSPEAEDDGEGVNMHQGGGADEGGGDRGAGGGPRWRLAMTTKRARLTQRRQQRQQQQQRRPLAGFRQLWSSSVGGAEEEAEAEAEADPGVERDLTARLESVAAAAALAVEEEEAQEGEQGDASSEVVLELEYDPELDWVAATVQTAAVRGSDEVEEGDVTDEMEAQSQAEAEEVGLAAGECGLTAWKLYVHMPGTCICQVRAKRTSKRREARLRLLHVPLGEIEHAVEQVYSNPSKGLETALARVVAAIADGHHIRDIVLRIKAVAEPLLEAGDIMHCEYVYAKSAEYLLQSFAQHGQRRGQLHGQGHGDGANRSGRSSGSDGGSILRQAHLASPQPQYVRMLARADAAAAAEVRAAVAGISIDKVERTMRAALRDLSRGASGDANGGSSGDSGQLLQPGRLPPLLRVRRWQKTFAMCAEQRPRTQQTPGGSWLDDDDNHAAAAAAADDGGGEGEDEEALPGPGAVDCQLLESCEIKLVRSVEAEHLLAAATSMQAAADQELLDGIKETFAVFADPATGRPCLGRGVTMRQIEPPLPPTGVGAEGELAEGQGLACQVDMLNATKVVIGPLAEVS
jgi:hypothetical protein